MADTTGLEQASLVISGVRSELRVEAGQVTISRRVTTRSRPTEVTFPVEAVRGTTLRRPAHGERGWLHVAAVGGTPAPVGELAASSDPYTLPLSTRHTRRARRLARLVERHIRARGLPADHDASAGDRIGAVAPGVTIVHGELPTPAPASAVAPRPSAAEEEALERLTGAELVDHLAELAALREQGALTDGEFQRAKDRVLGDVPG